MANSKKTTAPNALGPVAKGFKRVVRIRADREGFRRGGVKHSRTPTDHPIESFDETQMRALLEEPRLLVQVLDVPDEAAAPAQPE